MKNLIVIVSTLIGLNTGYAQTAKPILNNSFPNHITNFTRVTSDTVYDRYKRLYKFTDFVEEKSYKLLKQKEHLLDSININYLSAHYTFQGVSDTSFTDRSLSLVEMTSAAAGKYAANPEIVYNIKRDKKKNCIYVYALFIF